MYLVLTAIINCKNYSACLLWLSVTNVKQKRYQGYRECMLCVEGLRL